MCRDSAVLQIKRLELVGAPAAGVVVINSSMYYYSSPTCTITTFAWTAATKPWSSLNA